MIRENGRVTVHRKTKDNDLRTDSLPGLCKGIVSSWSCHRQVRARLAKILLSPTARLLRWQQAIPLQAPSHHLALPIVGLQHVRISVNCRVGLLNLP